MKINELLDKIEVDAKKDPESNAELLRTIEMVRSTLPDLPADGLNLLEKRLKAKEAQGGVEASERLFKLWLEHVSKKSKLLNKDIKSWT